jgi:hypothetical protein
MGIVLNQSLKNTIITYIGFGIGANTIYLYPFFLGATFYALTNYVTSSKCMPCFIFWDANTLVNSTLNVKRTGTITIFIFTVLFPLLSIPLINRIFFYIRFLLSCRGEPDS